MRTIFIVSNKPNSPSLKALSKTLASATRQKVLRTKRARSPKDVVFKVGTSKIIQLQAFQNNLVSCPEWTTSKDTAKLWVAQKGKQVMCRILVKASAGKGCVIAETQEELVDAPLYTSYIKKKYEYRVHVFDAKVIDKQIKRQKSGYVGTRDTRIRNVHNGYVFCREGFTEDSRLDELALKAVAALDQTYGAVDIIYNQKQDAYFVLEVNNQPGMQGTTLEKYTQAIVNRR